MFIIIVVVLYTVSIFLNNKGHQQISSSPSCSKHTSFPLFVLIHNLIIKNTMLTLSCKDVGFDCNHVVKAGTEEEVIRNITEHAIKQHGMKSENMTPKMKEIIRQFIHNNS
jgi:predicted small metal-binding protein